MPVQQMQNLLGVDETRTVFAALSQNKVPVYTVLGNLGAGETVDTHDFSQDTQLVLEWTFVEAFYEYDERGGNFANGLNFVEATTDDAVRTALQPFPKKEWVRIDAMMKPYVHTKNEIVHETANFNTQNFWNAFLQNGGGLSPLEKYAQDLQAATSKDIKNAQYQSTVVGEQKHFDILPGSTPYALVEGSVGQVPIVTEAWSTLPDARRSVVKISIKKKSDSSVVLEHQFFGSEINNVPLQLSYDGGTDIDKATIDSYGGIHATPADLVDIIPYFSMENNRFTGTSNIKIGDTLILEFEYFVNGNSIHVDQKFSVAGNNEGIYLVLSRVIGNALLDNDSDVDFNSKILLEGNTEIARQYLGGIEQQSELLEKSMDRSYNSHFLRAVVTQNRLLSEINGTPTTFDFKGLTMDASAYIVDYSNRGNYRNLEKDYHLLWGLQASYDEADVFEDITGVDSISTVKGLQYAYAHPEDYTVYQITSANENIIDTLSFSAGTKANMHTDVQSGKTVITPNKPVTEGIFTGVLYVSLKPDGTGSYAIGEQNGSNTLVAYNIQLDGAYKALAILNAYAIFQEDNLGGERLCNIATSDYTNAINTLGYTSDYGYPCFKESKKFGNITHSYILFTKGIKFYSPGRYDYWKLMDSIKSVLLTDKNNENNQNLSNIKLADGKSMFKFNPVAGTYSWYGTYNGGGLTAYYEPNSANNNRGKGHIVYGDILAKLQNSRYDKPIFCNYESNLYCNQLSWVLATLGFPLMNQATAADSIAETKGFYQSFVGGDVYIRSKLLGGTYYVPSQIGTYFGDSNNCRIINNGNPTCGTGGLFGFPISDPWLDGNFIRQKFEEADLFYDKNNQISGFNYQSQNSRRYQNKEYARKVFLDEVVPGIISDVEAFKKISSYIANRKDITTEDYVKDLATVLIGFDTIDSYGWNAYWDNNSPYDIQGFSDVGFKYAYNDSHYCMEAKI